MLNAQLSAELQEMVARFERLVKSLAQQSCDVADAAGFHQLEEQVRSESQSLINDLLGHLAQQSIDAHQVAHRPCPRCRISRRHKGHRQRQIRCSTGTFTVRSVYWRCPACGLGEQASDRLFYGQLSRLMQSMICFLGASTTSFSKAEQATAMLLGTRVDDQTLRRICLQRGHELARESQPRGQTQGLAVGSCDGTMVHTRETGWREVKACRFSQGEQVTVAASSERARQFGQVMARTAERANLAGDQPLVFVSDAAPWIHKLVRRHLPRADHVIDYWHACQHVFNAGKAIYGEHHPKANKWGRYWSKRLRRYGGKQTADRIRALTMHYHEPAKQKAVLKLARYLTRHARGMNYRAFEANGWPICSGPMESYCKQLGLRLKGRGMRWSVGNITPMATLVSYWSYEANPNAAA